jgi:hypothetical protein
MLDRDALTEEEANRAGFVPSGMIFLDNPLINLLKPETVDSI